MHSDPSQPRPSGPQEGCDLGGTLPWPRTVAVEETLHWGPWRARIGLSPVGGMLAFQHCSSLADGWIWPRASMSFLHPKALFLHQQNGELATNIPVTPERGAEVEKHCVLRKVLFFQLVIPGVSKGFKIWGGHMTCCRRVNWASFLESNFKICFEGLETVHAPCPSNSAFGNLLSRNQLKNLCGKIFTTMFCLLVKN